MTANGHKPTAYDADKTLEMVEREMRGTYRALCGNRRERDVAKDAFWVDFYRRQAEIAKALLWQMIEIRMSLTGRIRR